MQEEDLEEGATVWAKMRSRPPWPARIVDPSSTNIKPPKNKKAYLVCFFGSKKYAWIPEKNLKSHFPRFLNNFSKKKSLARQNAVKDWLNYLKKKNCSAESLKFQQTSGKNNNYTDSASPSCSITSQMSHEMTLPKSAHIQGKKSPKASQERIGFIGLGHMGRNIVKNMITSGHKVTVWNRTLNKCDEFVRLGAKKVASPADLIVQCDATFCCVSDKEASKAVICGNQGILQGLKQAKKMGFKRRGYVELTCLDVKTSQEINEAITMNHGVYLEAPMIGTRQDAENGSLVIFSSGSQQLFSKLKSCFHSIGRRTIYMESEIGYSTKISLIYKTIEFVSAKAMNEMLVMAEKLRVPQNLVMEVLLLHGPFSPENMMKIADKMMVGARPSALADFKETKKNLNRLMKAADFYSLRLPLASAVNQEYINPDFLQHH